MLDGDIKDDEDKDSFLRQRSVGTCWRLRKQRSLESGQEPAWTNELRGLDGTSSGGRNSDGTRKSRELDMIGRGRKVSRAYKSSAKYTE